VSGQHKTHAFCRGIASRTAITLGVLTIGVAAVNAQSIDQTMDLALRSSLSVKADNERQAGAEARLRGSVEAFLPSVAYVNERILSSRISYSPDYTIPDAAGLDTVARREPNAQGFQASMPLFDGFLRYNKFRSASVGVQAGKYLQLDAQQQAYLDAANGHLAIIRDRRILELRRRQVADISKIVERTKVRLSLRDVTQTDVDISRSRLLQAQADVEQAQADLQASEVEYKRITGIRPGAMPPPRVPFASVPTSIAELEYAVVASNAQLNASRLGVAAARYDAHSKLSEVMPKVNLSMSSLEQTSVSAALNRVRDDTVKVQMRVPIYEPGALSDISEAAALARQRSWEHADNQKRGVAKATGLYIKYQATRDLIKQADARVKAMQGAVDGAVVERAAGFRTVIDTLNIQNELSETEVARVNLEFARDSLVFTLAATLSRLGPDHRSSPASTQALRKPPGAGSRS